MAKLTNQLRQSKEAELADLIAKHKASFDRINDMQKRLSCQEMAETTIMFLEIQRLKSELDLDDKD